MLLGDNVEDASIENAPSIMLSDCARRDGLMVSPQNNSREIISAYSRFIPVVMSQVDTQIVYLFFLYRWPDNSCNIPTQFHRSRSFQ